MSGVASGSRSGNWISLHILANQLHLVQSLDSKQKCDQEPEIPQYLFLFESEGGLGSGVSSGSSMVFKVCSPFLLFYEPVV